MRLAVSTDQGACRREDQRGIVVLLGRWLQLGNTSADKVCICFHGDGRQGVEGGRLFSRGRRGKEGLGVFGEEIRAIGRVEALRKDDQSRASLCSFEDFAPSMREIHGLVRP
jgi:hypothetical protein